MGAVVVLGSNATSSMGRFGSALFPPVTLIHVEVNEPPPMLKPIWTLPSLVPTTTVFCDEGSKASWLMYERLPSDAFVRFAGLLTYHVFVPVAPVSVSQ